MSRTEVQVNLHPPIALEDPILQPHPLQLTMKMSLDYIAPVSNESGPQLPPLNLSLAKPSEKEKPTLPSLAQCQLRLPEGKENKPPSPTSVSDSLPRPPKLHLPSPAPSRASPVTRKLRVEPYPRFRDRHSSPYRSSSSTASSTRSSDSPILTPKESPKVGPLYPQMVRCQGLPIPQLAASKQALFRHPHPPTDIMIQRPLRSPSHRDELYITPPSPIYPPAMQFLSSPMPRPSAPCSRTSERPEYDSEELFAIAYLRLAKPGGVPWKEVKIAFNLLFPPGHLRRTSAPRQAAKNLLPQYSERDVGGLECRYYRIRTQERMGSVRKHRRNSDCMNEMEHVAMRSMQRELAKEWVKGLDARKKLEHGITLQPGETAMDLLNRAMTVYEGQSVFWAMLERVRANAVAGAFASRD